jgi:hypothetical protein
MKKILLGLLLFVSFYSNSQEIYSMGNGIYVCEYQSGTAGWAASGKTKAKTRQFVAEYAKEKQADYEIISMDDTFSRATRPIVKIKFRLIYESIKIATESSSIIGAAEYDQNGNQTGVVVTSSTSGKTKSDIKKDAIIELRELKSLLQDGILTQAEYDNKAEKLKKTILDN